MLRTIVTSTAWSMNPVSTSHPTRRSASTSAAEYRASASLSVPGNPRARHSSTALSSGTPACSATWTRVSVRALPRIARSSSS
jgi:hypothetical protein